MKVGDMVVCIKKDKFTWGRADGKSVPLENVRVPIYKNVYTVRGLPVQSDGTVGVLLEEIVNVPISTIQDGTCEPNFHPESFRPVKKTSIECFTSILEKA